MSPLSEAFGLTRWIRDYEAEKEECQGRTRQCWLFERARILERQREGIELAKAQGIYQRKLTDDDVQACRAMIDMGISIAEIARRYEVSRQTLYNALKGSGAYSPAR